MEMFRLGLIALLLLAGLASYEHSRCNTPDPYAVCASRQTQPLRSQCKNIVSFALARGL